MFNQLGVPLHLFKGLKGAASQKKVGKHCLRIKRERGRNIRSNLILVKKNELCVGRYVVVLFDNRRRRRERRQFNLMMLTSYKNVG
jgi:hypothetical protein